MKMLKLCLLAAPLLLGSLAGCSRASTKSPDASEIHKTFNKSGLELGDGREEVGLSRRRVNRPHPPSNGQKVKGEQGGRCGRWSRPLPTLKAVPEGRDKKLQAENESHPL